ncbi:hypothetical protein MNAN1_003902 [Malassezia nana]|uniref:Uncharacterized protein n=1 Tax=Malassezia nana TaxID=180528 RepID=A0AAF0EM00_9BASI|nr:hypothetical protein MNAN1_003902 [Malassezia nana]
METMQKSFVDSIRKTFQQVNKESLPGNGLDPSSILFDGENASYSVSPSYTPPKPQSSDIVYPMESSIYPVKNNIPRGSPLRSGPMSSTWGSLLDVDPLASNGITIEWKPQDDTNMPDKAPDPRHQEPTIDEAELWKMIHLLKEVLKEPSREAAKPDETLQHMLEAMDSTHSPGDGKTESTANALAMELRLEKISMDDAEYAQQLDKIRGQLGSLVTRLKENEAKSMDADSEPRTSQASKSNNVFTKSVLIITLYTFSILVLLLILTLHWLRFRAFYLYEFTYHDPLYQDFYPLPSYVESFLSPFVSYNVPFAI